MGHRTNGSIIGGHICNKNLYLGGEDKLEWIFMRSKGFWVNNHYMVLRGGNSFPRQSTSKVHVVFHLGWAIVLEGPVWQKKQWGEMESHSFALNVVYFQRTQCLLFEGKELGLAKKLKFLLLKTLYEFQPLVHFLL